MAHALALDSRDIAIDLHGLLRDMDPARWQDEVETALQQRMVEIEDRIDTIRVRFEPLKETATDESLAAVEECLDALSDLLNECAPAADLSRTDLRREWMGFRQQLQPAYQGLADSLRLSRIHVPSLRPTNYTRNLFHVGNALFCLVLVETVLTGIWMPIAAFFVAGAAWSMEFGKRREARVDKLTWAVLGKMGHPHERRRINSATWFSSALLLLSLTGSSLIAALGLTVLGLADPAAGLVGRRFGRIKLIHGRSLEGTTAFVVVGALGCLGVLTLWHPLLGWSTMVGITLAAVIPGALAELFAHKIDDNLLVPMAAAAGAIAYCLVAGIPL
ncbi:MAG: hypothetical protein QGH45_05695 [Myxococcota bacterium]|nr:hypothetical protein [Myxococcota bacterium]